VIKIRRGGSPAAREAGAVRFRGRRWWSGDWSAGRRRNLVRGLQRGDVVLMVLFMKEEKGWNFSSIRNRTAAESEIAGAAFWAAHARKEEKERIRKGQ
jgi:hypothetical protein